jgi:hypothetical protein
MARPSAGSAYYRVVVSLRNGKGEPEAPDSDTIYARLVKPDGTELADRIKDDNVGTSTLADSTNPDFPHAGEFWLEQDTSVSTGVFEFFIQVQSGDTEQDLTIEIGWEEKSKVSRAFKRTRVGDAADLDDILADTADIQPKIGSPVSTLAGDIATVDGNVDSILVDTTAIVADTNELQGDWTNGGRLDLILDELTTQGDTNETKIDAIPTAAENSDAVWDEAASGHTTTGTFGSHAGDLYTVKILAETAAAVAGTHTTTQIETDLTEANDYWNGMLAIVVDAGGAQVARRISDFANVNGTITLGTALPFTPADNDVVYIIESNPESPTVSGMADQVWDETLSEHVAAGSTGKALTDIEVDVTAILADTNELQTDWTNGGRLDLLIDGIITDIGDPSGDTITDLTQKLGDSGDASTTNSALGLLGDPTDAAVESSDGTEGSMFGKIRNIGTDVNQVITDIAALNDPSAAANADAVWDELTGDHTTASTFGKAVGDTISEIQNGTYGLSALDTDLGTILTAVQAVQNNTRFTAAIREVIVVPPSGNEPIEMLANLYDTAGNMEDPDDNEVMVRIRQTDGTFIGNRLYEDNAFATPLGTATDTTAFPGTTVTYSGIASGPFVVGNTVTGGTSGATGEIESDTGTVLTLIDVSGEFQAAETITSGATTATVDSTADSGWKAMKRDAIGRFSMFYKNTSTDTNEHVVFEFGWEETAVAIYHSRPAEISDFETAADAVWDETLSTHSTAGSTGKALADIETDVTQILSDTTAILVDTNELQTDWTDGGRLDLLIDGIITDIGDPSGDTLTSLTTKLGDSGDASTTNNVLGLLGDPTDAAVEPGAGAEGSMFGKLRGIANDIGDFTGNTNLQSLEAMLGSFYETENVTQARALQSSAIAEVDSINKIVYTGLSGTFQVAEVVTGGTSGATGTIAQDNGSTTMRFTTTSGTFQAAETITGGTSGATATVSTWSTDVLTITGVTGHFNASLVGDDFWNSSIMSVMAGTDVTATGLISDWVQSTKEVTYTGVTGTFAVNDIIQWNHQASAIQLNGDVGAMSSLGGSNPTSLVAYILAITGDPTSDTLSTLTAKLGDTGDASTTNTALGLLGQPTDAAVAADNTGEGSVFAKLNNIGDMTGDTANFATLAEKLGDPADAAVDPDSSNASIYAYIKHLEDLVDLLPTTAGARSTWFRQYFPSETALISADPSTSSQAASTSTQSTTYTALFQVNIDIPEGTSVSIADIFAQFHWEASVTGGAANTGNTQWYIANSAQTIDGSAALSGTTAISSEQSETSSASARTVSGRVVGSAFGTGDVWLILAGKVTNGADTMSANVYTDCMAEVFYQV